MLFKVWTTENFADESDRIGVIEAESLAAAIERLKAWNSEDLATTADYEQLSGAETTQGPGYASVTFRLRDREGDVGQDSYMLVPHEGPLMFLAEDWRQVFS
jgi:hypothetical protein